MTTHCIFLSSSYSQGTRIALDFINPSLEKCRQVLSKIKAECGEDVSVTVHIVTTDSPDFTSVQKYDPFFAGVRLIKSLDKFIALIQKDRTLKGIDIAKYILSLSETSCKHLTLEKLAYFCYADYMQQTKKKLFEDKILAYKYGPVIESIYAKFKHRGKDDLRDDLKDDGLFARTMPEIFSAAKSRILFAKDGYEKLCSIDKTLKKYSNIDSWYLADLTHTPGAPWSRTEQSKVIKDEDIYLYHHIEELE